MELIFGNYLYSGQLDPAFQLDFSVRSASGVMLGSGVLEMIKMQFLSLRSRSGDGRHREGVTEGNRNIMNYNYKTNDIKQV